MCFAVSAEVNAAIPMRFQRLQLQFQLLGGRMVSAAPCGSESNKQPKTFAMKHMAAIWLRLKLCEINHCSPDFVMKPSMESFESLLADQQGYFADRG